MDHQLNVLKKAAERTWGWMEVYGIDASWHVEPAGLTLHAGKGAISLTEHVPWENIDLSRMPTAVLKGAEGHALRKLGVDA